MIPIRLPWRHRARPSATLHEIQVCPFVETSRQTCPHDLIEGLRVRQPDSGSVLTQFEIAAVIFRLRHPERSRFSGRVRDLAWSGTQPTRDLHFGAFIAPQYSLDCLAFLSNRLTPLNRPRSPVRPNQPPTLSPLGLSASSLSPTRAKSPSADATRSAPAIDKIVLPARETNPAYPAAPAR
jgi:hypothetical protein